MRAAVCCIAAILIIPASRADAPTERQIRDAIEQLGDSRFAVRERAMKLLWNAGEAAEKPLAEAANSSDPEVVRRARILLDRIAYRVDPETPRDVVALMEKFRSSTGVPSEQSQVIRDMLRLGAKSYKYLLRMLDAIEPKQRRLILDEFAYDDWKILSSLTAAGQDDLVEQLLDKAIGGQIDSAVPHYAAFHFYSGKLDEKIARFRPGSKRGLIFDSHVLLALCRMKGDGDGAIEAAKKTESSFWIQQTLMENSRWADLLALQPKEPRGGMSRIVDLGWTAACQRLSGRDADLPDTLKRIQDYVGDKVPRKDNRPWYAAKVLLINEQPGLALALLHKFEQSALAAEILLSQAKYREAAVLTEKAAQAESGQNYTARGQHVDTLIHLGEQVKAGEWLDAMSRDMSNSTDAVWLDRLMRWELKLGRRASAEKRLIERIERRDGSALGNGFAAVFPTLGEQAETLWTMLSRLHPNEKTAETLKRLRSIDERSFPKDALDALLRANPPVNRNSDTSNFDAIGQVVAQFGLADTARFLLHAANWDKAPPQAKLYLADALANAGRWADAAQAYRQVWDMEASAPLPLFLHAQARLKVNPADVEAKALIEKAHRMPLGSESVRFYFYLALADRGFHDDAVRQIEFCCKLLTGNTVTLGNAQDYLAKALADRGEFLAAAAINDRSILRVMKTSSGFRRAGTYSRVTANLHALRARGLLEKGDKPGAFREMERAESLQPALLDLPILMVPALERAGEKERAAALYQRVKARWEQAARDYPNSADAHNQIAWLGARCRRDLDSALEHSRRAAALAPQIASYFDTMAEVHFQLGDREKALELMKKCLAMPDANLSFYRLQLKRFEKGDPKVEPIGD
jgi:tetratricopeptide (TPR) repeat protein